MVIIFIDSGMKFSGTYQWCEQELFSKTKISVVKRFQDQARPRSHVPWPRLAIAGLKAPWDQDTTTLTHTTMTCLCLSSYCLSQLFLHLLCVQFLQYKSKAMFHCQLLLALAKRSAKSDSAIVILSVCLFITHINTVRTSSWTYCGMVSSFCSSYF